ncbi:MAG: glycosyltransferase family 39 protein [Candidatus Omnitrophica bacterium]|nr:glycosyltransferase family 39 protein [Candidatus Omnitrophota bacterium]
MDLERIEGFKDKRVLLLLLLVIVLGAGLRFWGLDIQSLWFDELGSWSAAHLVSFNRFVNAVLRYDVNPPGYYIFLHYWIKLGHSEVMLRIPSAIFGTLSIGVIFLLGCRIYSWREGLVSAVLMAVMKCPLYYSQEARAYSMLLLFSMLTVLLLMTIVDCLRNRNEVPVLLSGAYVMTAIVSCYVHYYGLYFIVLQGLVAAFYFCRSREGARLFLIMSAFIVVAYLPWILVLSSTSRPDSWIEMPKSIGICFNDLLIFMFNDSQVFVSAVLALYCFLILRSSAKMIRSCIWSELLLIGWLIVPFVGAWVFSKVSHITILSDRYLIISLPAAYLLLSRSVILLPLNFKIKSIGIAVLTAVLLCHLILGSGYYSTSVKQYTHPPVPGHFMP